VMGSGLGSLPDVAGWGAFHASHGIVALIVNVSNTQMFDVRAAMLLASLAELRQEHENPESPLFERLSDRYGVVGSSISGIGGIEASRSDPSLKTSVALAPWQP